MSRSMRRVAVTLCAGIAVLATCLGASRPKSAGSSIASLGVDPAALSPVVDNPYAPWSLIKRAVYAGFELDDETKDTLEVRVVATVRDHPEPIAGAMATVVEFVVHEQGALV